MRKHLRPLLHKSFGRPLAGLAAAMALASGLGTGCTTVSVEQQRLLAKPGMQFSRTSVYGGASKIMPQVQPGLAVSGGAQASTCTTCR
jgi:hypothetical protein